MTDAEFLETWPDRAAARSPLVAKSRQRSIERARQIVDAAIELIAEKGTAFTIQELARRAEVALQTFYRHFSGKDELLLAVLERQIVESCVAFRQAAAPLPDPLARLRYYVTAALLSLDDAERVASRQLITSEHFRLQQLFPEELLQTMLAYTDLLVPEISAANELGLTMSTDPSRDAWFITQLIVSTFHHYSYIPTDGRVQQIAEELWQFCLGALGGRGVADAPVSPARRTG
jgi:AcrR family transcriptional regulator